LIILAIVEGKQNWNLTGIVNFRVRVQVQVQVLVQVQLHVPSQVHLQLT